MRFRPQPCPLLLIALGAFATAGSVAAQPPNPDPAPGAAEVVQLFPLQHAAASEMEGLLREIFADSGLRAYGDLRTQTLIVRGSQVQVSEVAALLQRLDQPAEPLQDEAPAAGRIHTRLLRQLGALERRVERLEEWMSPEVESVEQAQRALERAQERLDWTARLVRLGYVEPARLQAAEQAVRQARRALQLSEFADGADGEAMPEEATPEELPVPER